MPTWLKNLLQYEPAVAAWVAGGGLTALLISTLHLDPTVAGAVATLVSAAATVYTVVMVRPVAVPTLIGALATAATAVGAFGLHVPAEGIAFGSAVLSAVLGLLLRQNVIPTLRLATGGGTAGAPLTWVWTVNQPVISSPTTAATWTAATSNAAVQVDVQPTPPEVPPATV